MKLMCLFFGSLIAIYRFPPGVINTVPSLGHVGGAALAAHPDVDKVAFTGSTVTGRKIMEAAAKSNLKKVNTVHTIILKIHSLSPRSKVSLELGGKSPNIIFESADLEQGQIVSMFVLKLYAEWF